MLRLRKFKDVEIVGECGDGESAVQRILERSPDVVFLDIQMPGMDGFEVLRALPKEKLPAVIFLTAYEQHVLRAFDVHALHYLLKPVDDTRFATAVSRARELLDSASKADMAQRVMRLLDRAPDKYASRFTVQTGSRFQIVTAEEVQWIGAAGDYVELHVNGRSFLLRETMSSLEQRLDPEKFLRIHRSRIVQSKRILELRSIENREFVVKLADGSEHRSSRTYADRLERWLSAGRT
ncbi:MAG: LytTR family DNA-binding domain-containing protein [Terracidiphilus sp.]